jgi:protein-tyrosine-phosphatase
MAEGLLRELLRQRGVAASVDSAGLFGGGSPATDHAVLVLSEEGIDLSAHRSRCLADPAVELAGADLLLAMERRHVREAVATDPSVRDRTFTLVDAVRRAEAEPAREPAEPLGAWAARIGAGRTAAVAVGTGDDEVGDPVGSGVERYRETRAQLRDLLARLADRAWPEAGAVERSA